MSDANHSQKRASHVGAGLMAGAVLGLAAGLFLRSRRGQQLTRDAQKKAAQLQIKVVKRLQSMETLTRERYEEVVDDVLDYYAKSREVAKKEIPQVRAYLLGRWKLIESQLKQVK